MSIYTDDLRDSCGLVGELAADEIDELEKAYALLFKENTARRAHNTDLLEALKDWLYEFDHAQLEEFRNPELVGRTRALVALPSST